MCIIGNTIALGFDRYPMDAKTERVIELVNLLFFWVFCVEMLLKMLGLGFKMYFSDRFNAFDFIVVIVSCLDIGLSALGNQISGAEAI